MQLESGMFSSLIKRFYSPFCSSIRSSIIGIAYDFIRLILNKANEWIALIYTSSSPREIYKDAMRWCIWFEMQNTLTYVCGLVWRSHHWINETKPSENVATYDWIKSAFSVCVQSVDIFLQNECYLRQKKKKLAELGWHDTSIYIYENWANLSSESTAYIRKTD